MIFKRFYDDGLAQASYLIGCEKSREAIVVDPGLDVAIYERAAAADRLRITHVTETHIHADFVSGARSLAGKVDAVLHLSGEGDEEWGYTSGALKSAQRVNAGSRIPLGRVSLEAVHTPGHTPEHITFIVTDRDRGDQPVGALTGDFIFVGDVGRPDLLERAAGAAGSAERSGAQLFASIQEFKSRPDHLQLWPGHGAGSACGKALGSMPQTTLGYERLFNWAFDSVEQHEFVARALEHQPVPPRYFARMKKLNRDSATLAQAAEPPTVDADALRGALARGATVVDTRPAEAVAARELAGALNIPLGKSFLNWMGALVPYDRELFLIVNGDGRDHSVNGISRELRKIGLVDLAGYAGADVLDLPTAGSGRQERIDVRTLDQRRRDSRLQIIDVRAPDEWADGHLPNAIHIPLAALPDRIQTIDPAAPVVVHCQGGGRSAIAASFLAAHGVSDVANLTGGFDAWTAEGLPVERE